MRFVLDVQSRQTEGSGHRGVGRYSEGLAIHIARQRGDDEVRICLNAAYPDTIRTVSTSLQRAIGREIDPIEGVEGVRAGIFGIKRDHAMIEAPAGRAGQPHNLG